MIEQNEPSEDLAIDKNIFTRENGLLTRIQKIMRQKVHDPKDWRGTQFRHVNHLIVGEYYDTKRCVVLGAEGLVEIAFLPKIIPNHVCSNLEKLFENSGVKHDLKSSIIGGTWNRYGNGIFPVKSITDTESRLLDKLNDSCQHIVLDVLEKLNKNMLKKLDGLDDNIKMYKTYAKYPTMALNVLSTNNYESNNKPYRMHTDKHDSGMSTLLYFGDFDGGDLIISLDMKTEAIRFRIKRGDMILLNSKLFGHQVTQVTRGLRLGLVFFAGIDHFPIRKLEYSKKNRQVLPALPFCKEDSFLRESRIVGRKSISKHRSDFLKKYIKEKKRMTKMKRISKRKTIMKD